MSRTAGKLLKPLSAEEVELCKSLIEKGFTWKEIAARLKRPPNSIYHHYTEANKDYVPRRKASKRPAKKDVVYEDTSDLPNDVVFDFKDFIIY